VDGLAIPTLEGKRAPLVGIDAQEAAGYGG